ncbi:hypothetical protein HRbin02_00953 [Candidatus Calditenuaceae archaeon HR02]|nr:hypothetical protein HRbin02_00953 [Candidatus Calditenuaceae archaeon HR02]
MRVDAETRLEHRKAWAFSLLTSSIIITLLNGPLTVVKELTPLKGVLKATFGHHWVGHGVILLVLFIVLSLATLQIYRKKVYRNGHSRGWWRYLRSRL